MLPESRHPSPPDSAHVHSRKTNKRDKFLKIIFIGYNADGTEDIQLSAFSSELNMPHNIIT